MMYHKNYVHLEFFVGFSGHLWEKIRFFLPKTQKSSGTCVHKNTSTSNDFRFIQLIFALNETKIVLKTK